MAKRLRRREFIWITYRMSSLEYDLMNAYYERWLKNLRKEGLKSEKMAGNNS